MATAYPLYSPASAPGLAQFLDADVCKVGTLQTVVDTYVGGKLGVGTTTPATLAHFAASASAGTILTLEQASGDADACDMTIKKARGTIAAPTVITTGDDLGHIDWAGYSGAGGYVVGARIEAVSEGTIATTRVPTYLRFWTGTDAAPTVLTERMRIDSAGNVGIGTTSLSYPLTLGKNFNGSTQMLVVNVTSGASALAGYKIYTSAAVNADIMVPSSTHGETSYRDCLVFLINSDVSTSDMVFSTAAALGASYSEKMRIRKDGKIGIGTASPSYRLQVVDNVTDTVALVCNNWGTGGACTLDIMSSDSSLTPGTASRWALLVGGTTRADTKISSFAIVESAPGSGTRFIIKTGGKVGIGTESPLAGLHLASESGNGRLYVSSFSSTSDPVFFALRGRGTHASPSAVQSGDSLGTACFAGQWGGSSSNYTSGAVIQGKAAENWDSGGTGGHLLFYTVANRDAGNVTVERMRISQDGKIGIGTASPSCLLDTHGIGAFNVLTGTDNVVLYLYGGDPTTLAGKVVRLQLEGNSSGSASVSQIVSGHETDGNASQSYLSFWTRNVEGSPNWSAERVRITSAGNLCVGVASSRGGLFQVTSSGIPAQATRTTTSTNGMVTAYTAEAMTSGNMADGFGVCIGFAEQDDTASGSLGLIGAVRDGADNTGALVFHTSVAGSYSEKMRIKYDGKVGIGTASPDTNYLLTVNGTIKADDINGVFTATQEPTGFVNHTATLSWTDTGPDRTFTITGAHDIYIKGVKYSKTTTSIQIANTDGDHFIYYNSSGVLSETTDFNTVGFFLPLVASVYWNSTMAKGIVGEERHGITMDGATHGYLHATVGARYNTGLALSAVTNTTFQVDAGSFYDEDILNAIGSNQTTCDVFYRDGSTTFKWQSAQTALWGNTWAVLNYNNVNTLSAVSTNNYAAYWVFASNSVSPAKPIVVIIGQRQDTSIANARANNVYDSLTFGALPFKEMKLLFRVIYRNVGGTPTYIESADYRTVSNLPSGTYVATSHSSLSDLLVDTHTQYALLAGRTGGQILIGGSTADETLTLRSRAGLTTGDLVLKEGLIGVGTASPLHTFDIRGDLSVKTHADFAGSEFVTTTAAVQTTTGSATDLWATTLADNTLYWVEISVIGRDTAGVDRAYYVRTFYAYRQGGGAVLGNIVYLISEETSSAWDVTVTTSTNDIKIQVTGAGSTTINWAGTVKMQAVSGNT